MKPISDDAGRPKSMATLRRMLGYIARQRARLTVAVFFLVLGSVSMAFQPLLFGNAVNELSTGDSSNATRYAIAIVAVAVTSGLLMYIANRQLAILAQRAMEDLRNTLFAKMQTLSLAFFDSESSGDLNARITSDIEAVNQFFSAAVSRIISAGLTVVTMLIIMLSLDAIMTFVVLLIVPLALAVMVGLGRRVQSDFASYQRLIGELNGFVEEAVEGQRTVRAFAREADSVARVNELSEAAREVDRSSQFLSYAMQPANALISNIDVALVALIGGARAVTGTLSLGDVVSFIGYAQQFGGQTRQLTQVVTQVMSAIAGANRVFEILDRTPSIADSSDAHAMDSADGKVDFNHVDFRYTDNHQILFDNDFHVEPGQMIGLVGPTTWLLP